MVSSRTAPAGRIVDAGAQAHRARRLPEDEVVVVAAAEDDLLVRGVDELADPARLAEVKRRPGHAAQLAGGNQALSTGVNVSASRCSVWSRIVGEAPAERLK